MALPSGAVVGGMIGDQFLNGAGQAIADGTFYVCRNTNPFMRIAREGAPPQTILDGTTNNDAVVTWNSLVSTTRSYNKLENKLVRWFHETNSVIMFYDFFFTPSDATNSIVCTLRFTGPTNPEKIIFRGTNVPAVEQRVTGCFFTTLTPSEQFGIAIMPTGCDVSVGNTIGGPPFDFFEMRVGYFAPGQPIGTSVGFYPLG